ncbi:oligomycin resistance ATP-dependent permease [Scheffersomyces coipomensis]|uniref:oligomycin resistance ATP-dependent permease n=1 Tax=Scheffersomyces coipomensis TaxID=1788519 RepID=UPI00315DA33B
MNSEETSLEVGTDMVPQKRLLTFLFPKKNVPIPDDHERKPHPFKDSNILNRAFFYWVTPVMNVGYRRTLQANDLYYLPEDMKIEYFNELFQENLSTELEYSHAKHIQKKCRGRGETVLSSTVSKETDLQDFKLTRFNLLFALVITFKKDIFYAFLFALIGATTISCQPFLTKNLIAFVENRILGSSIHLGSGIGYAIGVTLVNLLSGATMAYFQYCMQMCGASTKSVLTNLILKKSLVLDANSRHKFPDSKITSLMSTDLSRVERAYINFPLFACLPIAIVISIALLIVNIGLAGVIGVLVFLIFLVAISLSTKQLYTYRTLVSGLTDERVKVIREIINNLKIIKFYSWEVPYLSNAIKARTKEVAIILKIQSLRNIIDAVATGLTGITAMISFLVLYGLEGSTRNAASMFSSVTSFDVLSFVIYFIPVGLSTTADMLNGLKRIAEFLSCDEIKTNEFYTLTNDESNLTAIDIKHASFSWENFDEDDEDGEEEEDEIVKPTTDEPISQDDFEKPDSNFPGLLDINLSVKKGEFVVITGSIGSGKTSLLSAVANIMKCDAGEIIINGSLLNCGAPWIHNATIKDNILFGATYEKERYDNVVYACALQTDIDNLEAGDLTEVGEKGVSLSGGQKARINLARAVYANQDIILLDDVLSAVDARVGKHVVKHCILGLLKDKTVLLATHQLSLIGSADSIVYLNGDGTIDVGSLDSLNNTNPDFRRLMAHSSTENEEKEEESIPAKPAYEESDIADELIPKFTKNSFQESASNVTRRRKAKSEEDDNEEVFRDVTIGKDASKGKIIQKEERAVNRIKNEVYFDFIKYGSGKLTPYVTIPLAAVLLTLATFTSIFSNTWLSFWISKKFEDRSNSFYIIFYVIFNILYVVFLTGLFVLLANITTNSSKNLILMAIKRVLHTPMSYLDVTPMGRIINRFTKDTDTLDNEIVENLKLMLQIGGSLVGILILLIIYLPYFAIAIPFIGILFVAIASYYQASCREIKRLEAIQRSFVYDNFNETLTGMSTIKAYKAEKFFLDRSNQYINNMNEASFLVFATQRWLAVHLEILADVVILITSIFCVTRVFSISSATAGLLISYSLQIAGSLSMVIRTFVQFENDMNSTERICHYALKLDQEAPYTIQNTNPSSSWPQEGSIKFEKVSMNYRPGLPLVLKELSFDVKPGQKIGICGRTGAGKSSIMTVLYRICELEGGKISIDGVDISTLGLYELRSKLSIIPQDPVLFNGTIRDNLDPFGEHEDSKLFDAIRRAGLMTMEELQEIQKRGDKYTGDSEKLHKFHLDQVVEDEGENYSLGERQLIVFVRALVRDSKILILDEATSSVDYETDSKIQKTIATEFKDCTILCIAHRLKTIINYDKILTMDRGEIKEFDTPWMLFNSDNGIFRQMCEKSQIVAGDFLNEE